MILAAQKLPKNLNTVSKDEMHKAIDILKTQKKQNVENRVVLPEVRAGSVETDNINSNSFEESPYFRKGSKQLGPSNLVTSSNG